MSFPADVPPADNHVQRALSAAPEDDRKRASKPSTGPAAAGTGTAETAGTTGTTGTTGTGKAALATSSASSQRAVGSAQEQKKKTVKQQKKKQLPPGTAPGQADWEYKRRMPKQRATAWPSSILSDPDVLSLDDEGRFVLCKVCHVHYAVHGGKKPKPVIMNSIFRTRAWEVHKERTNSHRMQKRVLESAAQLEHAPSSPVVTQQQQDREHHRQRQQQMQMHQALRQHQFQSRQPNQEKHVAPNARHQLVQESRNEEISSSHRQTTRDADPVSQTQSPHTLPSLQRVQSDDYTIESSAQSRAPMLVNNLMSEQDLRKRVSGNERLFIRPAGTVSVHGGSNRVTPVHSEGQASVQI